MRFESPWALLVLLAVPALLYLRRGGRGRGAFHFATTDAAREAGGSLRQRFLWFPTALHIVALISTGVALARPQYGMTHVRSLNKGVAIEMLMDISSSMDISMDSDRERESRLEVAKRVFEEFIVGVGDKGDLAGRPNDLIGMITFARYADTVCPLTLGHDALQTYVRGLHIEDRENEDGTAIGDAIALAAARLRTVEDTLRRQSADLTRHEEDGPDIPDYEIESKVIVLLTDGENNSGTHLPLEGAALAKKWGIRIHAIGFGDRPDTRTVDTPDGPRKIDAPMAADTRTLAKVADATGGVFRMAHDADGLRAVYEEIDRMEKSDIETLSYRDYKDRFAWFALAALACLFLEALLRSTLLRRIP